MDETWQLVRVIFLLVGMATLGTLAIYHAVAWLRSRRKRPGQQLQPQGAREIAMVEQAWREGWEAGYKAQNGGWKKWSDFKMSHPSSPPTPGPTRRPRP